MRRLSGPSLGARFRCKNIRLYIGVNCGAYWSEYREGLAIGALRVAPINPAVSGCEKPALATSAVELWLVTLSWGTGSRIRRCRACRATSPFSLPRAYLIGRPAVCCGVVLPVCPCVVSFSKFHEPDTHDLLRTCRYHPRSILVRHARFPRDMLATSTRRCDEDASRKLLPWNSS